MAAKPKLFSKTKPKSQEMDDDLIQVPPTADMLEGCAWLNAVTEASARDLVAGLLRTTYSDPNRPIMLYIDSPGGEVSAMNAILNAMDSIPNKIVTICMGRAYSAAAVILAHGDLRFVGPHGRVMIHEISGGAIGNIVDVAADAQEMDTLNRAYLDLLAKDCKVKGGVKALRKLFAQRRDCYFGPQEAVDFGLADAVGVPRLVKANQWLLDNPVDNDEKKK